GTLLTGFLLAPLFDIDLVLRLTAAAVAVIGLAGLADARRGTIAGAVLAAILLAPPAPEPARPGETVFAGDTPFQRVEVVTRDGERWLYLNGCVHTHVTLEPPYRADTSYIAGFEMLPSFRPDARSLLVVGLGGGALLPLFDPEEYETTVVEIDPVVVRVARDHFRTLPEGIEVHIGDARPYLRRAGRGRDGRKWDLVALDVCDSDRMPEHLVTLEFFRELKQSIAPGGAMAMNSIGPTGGRSLAAFGATLREVFAHVTGYAVNPGGEITNVIWYASDEPLELSWAFYSTWEDAVYRTESGDILTDRWNPVNHWNAPVARRIRMTHDERY
ncbi:MAG: fused MFS/spermidine synthase, partial [Planctomycetota bacterium]